MPVFLLAFLAPLLGKLPSLQAAKWIAGLVLFVAMGGLGFALGHHWEASVFEKYKADAAKHELELQHSYDAIGATVSKDYADKLAVDLAETQRQLQELHDEQGHLNAPVPSRIHSRPQPGKSVRGDTAAAAGDSARIVRVLRSAAGR